MPNKPLPQFVAPMAAASVKEPFDSLIGFMRPKLDGYRAITVIDSTGKARHRPVFPVRYRRQSNTGSGRSRKGKNTAPGCEIQDVARVGNGRFT
jgi:hypothetical protein